MNDEYLLPTDFLSLRCINGEVSNFERQIFQNLLKIGSFLFTCFSQSTAVRICDPVLNLILAIFWRSPRCGRTNCISFILKRMCFLGFQSAFCSLMSNNQKINHHVCQIIFRFRVLNYWKSWRSFYYRTHYKNGFDLILSDVQLILIYEKLCLLYWTNHRYKFFFLSKSLSRKSSACKKIKCL